MRLLENVTVTEEDGGLRLTDFGLKNFRMITSRNGIKKAIKKNLVRIDRETGRTATRVRPGQTIEVYTDSTGPAVPPRIDLDVPYEDDDLALVFKPPGLPVRGNRYRTLENGLPAHLQPSSLADALPEPQPVHRLDARTRGLVICAKTVLSLKELSGQFQRREVRKVYRAITIGMPAPSGQVSRYLDGRPSLTRWLRLQTVPSCRYGCLSLVELYPVTGRTHQLRRHMGSMNTPVLGDELYGPERTLLRGKGLFLAALGLCFVHPRSGEEHSLALPTPEKFTRMLERERQRFRSCDHV
jgi:RluA family pseudouridine synthase